MLDDSGDPDFKDEYGIREAYYGADGIAVHGDTMYISGTRLDRLSGLRDVLDDVTFVPLREAYNTQRYQQALAALKKSKGRGRSAAALFRQRAGEVLSSPVRSHLHAGSWRRGEPSAGAESSHPRWLLTPRVRRASDTKDIPR